MKSRLPHVLALAFASYLTVSVVSAFEAEAGVSYLIPRKASPEGFTPNSMDDSGKAGPYIAGSFPLNDFLALRLSYHYFDNLHATATYSSAPGSMLPVVVYGQYNDDVHLASLASDFKFRVLPQLTLSVAPQLNWVASRGRVAFSTTDPTVLLVGPHNANRSEFTGGASARGVWAFTPHTSVVLSYEYLDLHPSFGRKAHLVSGGVLWVF